MINFFKSFPLISYTYVDDGTEIASVDINRNVKAYIEEIDNANAYTYYNISTGSRPDQVSMALYKTPVYYWTFFVLNQHLLDGLHGWPKSSYELTNYIDEHYNRIVITNISKTLINDTDHLIFEKIFAVGQTVEGQDSGATGIIDEVDPRMNRIFLTNVTGTFIDEDILVTVAAGIDLDTTSNANMTIELKSMISNDNYRVVVEEEKNATHHYLDSNGYQIERLRFSDDENLYEVTNYQYEVDLNDSRMQIRVMNPNMINEFATQYKKLINA